MRSGSVGGERYVCARPASSVNLLSIYRTTSAKNRSTRGKTNLLHNTRSIAFEQ